MRIKLFGLLCLFLFLVALSITPVFGVDEGEWIVEYRVEDLETGQLIVERDFQTGEINEDIPLFGGSELLVTITVDVDITASYADLRLATRMAPSTIEDRYWELHTQDYQFVDYNPAQQFVEFQWRYLKPPFWA